MAAEPMVADPITIAFSPDGKVWVVEMGGYPLGDVGGNSASGRIRFLEDTDGDGELDRSVVFLDKLEFPTGVLPWRKGVLVACAPDIFYAEDTDGDGRADQRNVLFTGFIPDNPQHRVNGLRLGLDNWVHCANGDNGGTVQSIKTGRVINIRNHDFRIQPDHGSMDLESGMSQFCRCRDDWGNWFGGNSVYPFWHCVLADHYMRRNPHVVSIDPCVHLMNPPINAPVHAISAPIPRMNEPQLVNRFTSACGADVYRDELFGPRYAKSYFVCAPAHNLVRCEIMNSQGTTFRSRPLLEGDSQEFLASTDNWFRPTQVRTGPDGALWIVDMYRLVIEHPDFIVRAKQQGVPFGAGQGRGRIYRVRPVDAPQRSVRRLDHMTTKQLVTALDSSNGPQRDLVQQLLVDRRDKKAIPFLETLVRNCPRATCRLQALCTLDGLGNVRSQIIQHALKDPHPSVRRHALRIGESRLPKSVDLQSSFLRLVQDADATVRLQLAFSLGEWGEPTAGMALAQIANKDLHDPFIIEAVMSSASKHHESLLTAIIDQGRLDRQHAALLSDLLVMTFHADRKKAFASSLRQIASSDNRSFATWQFDVIAKLLDALDRRNTTLSELHDESDDDIKTGLRSLDQLFTDARRIATNRQEQLERRISAARILGRGLDEQEQDAKTLATLLSPHSHPRLQVEVVRAMGKIHRPEIPHLLLADWSQHSPRLRASILDVLVNHYNWIVHILDPIESRQIDPRTIGLRHRGPLILHPSASVRRRAAKAFGNAVDKDRQQVVLSHQRTLKLQGDPTQGELVFRQHCSTCHLPTETGICVGPDLWALTDRSPQALLTGILHPNLAIDPRYISYTALTTNGLIRTGIILRETGNSIILIDAQGKRHTLLRSEIEVLTSNGRSLMPEGLESELLDQDLANLIAYLTTEQPASKRRVSP